MNVIVRCVCGFLLWIAGFAGQAPATYIGAGALESTTPQHQSTANEYAFGDTRFNLGNRTHTELLTRGNLRIIAVELK